MLQGARRSLKIHIINFALDRLLKICYNVCIAENSFASALKSIKNDLDKIKDKCYNKYIGKQKKYFVPQGIAGLTK